MIQSSGACLVSMVGRSVVTAFTWRVRAQATLRYSRSQNQNHLPARPHIGRTCRLVPVEILKIFPLAES
jgi:hypothetical protein